MNLYRQKGPPSSRSSASSVGSSSAPCATMGSVTLEFSEAAVEARYKQHWSLTLKSRDLQSYWVFVAIVAVFIATHVGKTRAADLPTALLVPVVLVHGACVMLPTADTYSRYRNLVVCMLRCLYLVVAAYGNSLWYFSPPATFAAACRVAVIGSGVSISTFTTLGLLVPVKVQLPLQLLSVATFAWLQNGETCATLQSTQAGADFILSAWTWGHRASGLLTRITHPVAFLNTSATAALPLEAMCFNVVAFMQAMAACLLLTTIVYVLERASRQAFLARHCKPADDKHVAANGGFVAWAWLLFRAFSVIIMTWEVIFTLCTVMYKRRVPV